MPTQDKVVRCELCSVPKILWHDAYFCLKCDDNGRVPPSTWAVDFAKSIQNHPKGES